MFSFDTISYINLIISSICAFRVLFFAAPFLRSENKISKIWGLFLVTVFFSMVMFFIQNLGGLVRFEREQWLFYREILAPVLIIKLVALEKLNEVFKSK